MVAQGRGGCPSPVAKTVSESETPSLGAREDSGPYPGPEGSAGGWDSGCSLFSPNEKGFSSSTFPWPPQSVGGEPDLYEKENRKA